MTYYFDTTFTSPEEDSHCQFVSKRKKIFIDTIDQFDYDTMKGHIVIVRDFKDIAFENVRKHEFDYSTGNRLRAEYIGYKVKRLFDFDLPENERLISYPDFLIDEFKSLGYKAQLYYFFDDDNNAFHLCNKSRTDVGEFVVKNKLDLFKKFGSSFAIVKNPSQWLCNTLTTAHKKLDPNAPDNVLTEFDGFTIMPVTNYATHCVVEDLYANVMPNVGFVWKIDLSFTGFISNNGFTTIPRLPWEHKLYNIDCLVF